MAFVGGKRHMDFGEGEDLPPELVLRILSFLSGADILTGAALASKHWRALAQDEHLWRGLCERDVSNISLLSLLQVDSQKKENDLTSAELALLRSREAFLYAKPADHSWLWLWRSQNVKVTGKSFTGVAFGMSEANSGGGGGGPETKIWQYSGEWKDGRRHGYGKCIWNNGTWYQGHWENDTRQGNGKIVWKGGGYYEGSWKDGFQDGFGILHTRNEFTFEGNWTKNELNGEGLKFWFENGKRESFQGSFKQTKAHGYGHRQYGNGSAYDGQYVQDRRVGLGVFTWPSCHQFAGEWQVGRRKGRFICPDGREFEQMWREEKMQLDLLHAPGEVEVTAEDRKIRNGLEWLQQHM